jgi:hypothetical protein
MRASVDARRAEPLPPLHSVYRDERILRPSPEEVSPGTKKGNGMVLGLAVAIFIALFGWGSRYFGWSDPEGKIQLALITSFILGIIGGFKARG